jgi:hypothetical protein
MVNLKIYLPRNENVLIENYIYQKVFVHLCDSFFCTCADPTHKWSKEVRQQYKLKNAVVLGILVP